MYTVLTKTCKTYTVYNMDTTTYAEGEIIRPKHVGASKRKYASIIK
jgi:hypothetical protein